MAKDTAKIVESITNEATMSAIGVVNYRKNRERAKAKKQETTHGSGHRLMVQVVPLLATAIRQATELPKDTRKSDNSKLVASSAKRDSKGKWAGKQHQSHPFIRQVEPEVAALITARTVFDGMGMKKKLTNTAGIIGSRIEDEVRFRKFQKADPWGYKRLMTKVCKSADYRYKHRVLTHCMNRCDGLERWENWGSRIKIMIGSRLIDLMAKNTQTIEVAYIKRAKVLVPTAQTLAALASTDEYLEVLMPWYLPMVDKPLRWTSPFDGGYLSYPLPLVKDRPPWFMKRLETVEMPEVYEAVNRVQETPWKINQDVLTVLEELWERAFELPGLPSRDPVDIPPSPPQLPPRGEVLNDVQKEILAAWKFIKTESLGKEVRRVSQLVFVGQLLAVARMLREAETLYFPHTLDWRGRMYAAPIFLSPQGNDLARSLLHFAEGKAVHGVEAWRWFLIHGANCFGEDKVSFEARERWVREHHKQILEVGADPVSNLWWTEADDPWQFMAWCLEYSRAENFPHENEAFVSHLPVAMDGSCNGLQHFSAMLRDPVGGKAVNLTPTDEPQDIYSAVCDVVVGKVVRDKEHGTEYEQRLARQWLVSEQLERAAVKRQVMTKPYGASKHGMHEQLVGHLAKQRDKFGELPFESEWEASRYLTPHVFNSIDEIVVAAKSVMEWLQQCAKLIAKTEVPVSWTTPLGFPVIQLYFRQKHMQVETQLMGRVQLRYKDAQPALDKRKARSGLSPNLVHSIDSTHMMLTMNAMPRATCWAMVHDSFGVHAADATLLAKVLRDTFVTLYQEHDILMEFHQEAQRRFNIELPPPPPKGSLEIEDVRRALFFFA